MKTDRVSVVIPTYNSARYIGEALESVFNQTIVPSEVIVVDDGSSDDTRERIRPYSSRLIYHYQSNQGVSAARNLGVSEASGEFIAFLDSDDVWHPRKLELQLEVFQQQKGLGLLGTGAIDWPGQPFSDIGAMPADGLHSVSWSDLAVKNRLITSSVIARASTLRKAGDFDTALQGPEDRDLWIRMAKIAPVSNLELPLTGYRTVPGSVSMQPNRCQEGMLRILSNLDDERAWEGRGWLRRKAYAYVYHSCAYIFLERKLYGQAMQNVLRSILWYPLPFRREEVRTRFERLKRLAVAAFRCMRAKSNRAD